MDRAGCLAFHHRDRHAPDIALGVDLNGLLVAAASQRQAGAKSRRLDDQVDLAAARGSLQAAEDVAVGLIPLSRNPLALACHLTIEVEFVAVAGAAKALFQTEAGLIDAVFGTTTNALVRSVGERDGSLARPSAVEAGKWARLRLCGGRRRDQRANHGAGL